MPNLEKGVATVKKMGELQGELFIYLYLFICIYLFIYFYS